MTLQQLLELLLQLHRTLSYLGIAAANLPLRRIGIE